ncbi:DUF6346 domain-containing protein [Micromonospora pallida]|uniref:DUF6346 domain-containing protein n=1 Tax=Micromonospora pallida TaxID=145854 RepID=UPI003CCC0CA5
MTAIRRSARIVGVVKILAISALIAVTAATVSFGIRTVGSSYSGTGLGIAENRMSGLATPKSCWDVGPISSYGFGYWWSCAAQVRMSDGRVLDIETDASTLRPGERDVPMVESCQKSRPSKCVYTQPGNFALALGVRLLRAVSALVTVIGAVVAGAVLVSALRGRRRYGGLAESGHSGDVSNSDPIG